MLERIEMKIQTSREIRITHQEDGKLLVLYTNPNGLDMTSILESNVFAMQSGESSIHFTPIKNGAIISRLDGGILSFRESEHGLMIASDLIELVDFKKSNYLKFTLDLGKE